MNYACIDNDDAIGSQQNDLASGAEHSILQMEHSQKQVRLYGEGAALLHAIYLERNECRYGQQLPKYVVDQILLMIDTSQSFILCHLQCKLHMLSPALHLNRCELLCHGQTRFFQGIGHKSACLQCPTCW